MSIVIGVDDIGILRVRNDQPGGKGAWPFFTPFNLILNLAMGGDWAGAKGMDDAALPQRMEVRLRASVARALSALEARAGIEPACKDLQSSA